MAYLVQSPDGERSIVGSLDGHDGWTVIAENVGPVDPGDLKRMKRAEVDSLLAAAFAEGFTPATGPLAGYVLQVRGIEDRTNWLTSQAAYASAIAAGFGDVVDASFRTADNQTVIVTYAEGHDALMQMAAWGKALMARSWAVKDQIETADLGTFDVAAAWASA